MKRHHHDDDQQPAPRPVNMPLVWQRHDTGRTVTATPAGIGWTWTVTADGRILDRGWRLLPIAAMRAGWKASKPSTTTVRVHR